MAFPGTRFSTVLRTLCGVLMLLAWLAPRALAQEALRVSMAGDQAAAQRKQAATTIGYYNLMVGQAAMRFAAGLGLEYSDNVRNNANGEGDTIVRPAADIQLHWPVTEWNALDVSLNAGYSYYLSHRELNQFYINPGSGLAFDVYVGDWVVNFHDRATVTQNTYENPTATSSGRDNTFFQNVIGVSGLWDLNKMVVNVGYDHVNYIGLGTAQVQPDSASENVSANAGVRLVDNLMVGVAAGAGFVRYAAPSVTNILATPDATQWNAGVFSRVQVSEHLSGRLETGYTVFTPETVVAGRSAGLSAMYFQLTGTHRVGEHVNYSLSMGRSVDFSYNGQSYDRLFVRLNPTWNVLWKCSISTPLWWEKGVQVVGQNLDYTQFGAGFNISRPITNKLSANAHYQWVKRTANMEAFDYTVNIVGLSLHYRF